MKLGQKKVWVIILPFILVIAGIAGMFYYQSATLQKVQSQANDILTETASEQSEAFRSSMDSQSTILRTLAASLAAQEAPSRESIAESMRAVASSGNFMRIFFVEPDGSAFSGDGLTVNVSDREYFHQALQGITSIQKINYGKLVAGAKLIIAVPFQKNGAVSGVLYGSCDEEAFRRLLLSRPGSDASYSFITNGSGDIVIAQEEDVLALGEETNLLTAMRKAHFTGGSSLQMLMDGISSGASGVITFTLGGISRYAAYQSVGINDWMLFSVEPASTVEHTASEIVQSGYLLILLLCAVFLCVLVVIVSSIRRQIHYVEIEEDYRNQLSLYRSSQVGGVFRVKVDRFFSLLYANDKFYQIIEYTPQTLRIRLDGHCIEFICPQDRAQASDIIHHAIETQQTHLDLVIKIISGHGTIKYLRLDGQFEEQQGALTLYGVVLDVTGQKVTENALEEEKDALQMSEQRFRIALENTSVSIWEYDVRYHRIEQGLRSQSVHGFGKIVENVPESLIASGFVAPECIGNYRELFHRIDSGVKTAEGIFRVQNPERSGYWYEYVRYTTVFSSDGKPSKAIGVSEDVTEHMDAIHKYETESALCHILPKDGVACVCVDLDGDRVENLVLADLSRRPEFTGLSPDALLGWVADRVPQDDPAYPEICSLNVAALRQAFDEGRERITLEFRGQLESGVFHWFGLEVRLLRNPANKSLFAFLYLRDIDVEKQEMETLEKQAHTDSLTGVCNVSTARELIDAYLSGVGSQQLSAMLMLDLDNFKQVNDRLSHAEGDRVLINLANELRRQFRESDILARIGGDEFIVFIKNIPSVKFICQKADALCEALQFTQTNGEISVHVSCSIGIALCRGAGTYQQLYHEADTALYRAKNSGKGRYCVSEHPDGTDNARPEEDGASLAARNNTIQLSALLQYMEGGVHLIEVSDPMQVLYVSPSYYTSTGIAQENGPRAFEEFLALVDESERENLVASLRRGAETHQVVDLTYRVTISSKVCSWHHLRAVNIPYQGASAPVLIAVITDVTEWQNSTAQLSEDRSKLALALEQTDLRIWNYDRTTHTLRADGDQSTLWHDLPDSMIQNDRIHPDSLERFREFFHRMESSDCGGRAVLKTRHLSDDYAWLSLSFTNIFDDSGHWVKTIGVTHRLPYIDSQLAWLEQEAYLQKTLHGSLIATVQVNLNTRAVEHLQSCEHEDFLFTPKTGLSYDEVLCFLEKILADPTDTVALRQQLLPEKLIEDYENDRRWITREFRVKTDSGRIRWVTCSINLLSDPVSGQLLGFGYLQLIDARKRWENTLEQKVIYDPRTCLYDTHTSAAMVEHLLNAVCGSRKNCLLAILRIEGLACVESSLGYSAASNILFTVGRLCSITLDAHFIVGSAEESHIVFFDPDLASEEQAKRRVVSLLATLQGLHHKVFPNIDLSFLVGCAVSPCPDATYSKLCSCALETIGRIGELPFGQDTAYLFDYSLMQKGNAPASPATAPLPARQSTTQDEDAKALTGEWMRRIILSTSSGDCAERLLPLLGAFYRAERVFTLQLSEDDRYISVNDEWCTEGVASLAEKLSNVPAARLPGVTEALKTRRTVVISADSSGRRPFLIAPVQDDSRVQGLICIDTPTLRLENTAVLTPLAEYWRQAYSGKAFSSSGGAAFYLDPLTGLFNRNKYSSAVAALSKGELSSLGIAFADLNGLAAVNSQLGSSYGDEMILFAAQCFEQAFGRENVYRISGDEFVALVESVTYERFGGDCDRVKEMFEEKFQDGMSIGYAWADTDIKLKSMEEHAKAIMKLCKQNYYEQQMKAGTLQRPELLARLQKELAEGRYVMYLQPKVSIQGGALCGAEALVRYQDSERGLVTPIAFIKSFEAQNIIRHVDLFMLEEAAKLLQRWQEEALPLIPIAVNFSRKTFLDRTVLQRAAEIVQHYGIPFSLLEIEITESVADVERVTLANFCRRYKEKGFLLALDDFGSEYSSLSVLSAIHFDVLKLDKSLVNDITVNNVSRIIVQNTMSLCKQLHTTTVAEGVETAEQLELLSKMGCDVAQGYYFNKPLPPDIFCKTYCTRQEALPPLPLHSKG